MRLFGKKKEPQVEEANYEIFGGCTITKGKGGYNIMWRSPNLTTITLHSMPEIAEDIQVKREGDTIHVLSTECKLRIITKEGSMEARVSKI